MIRIEEEAWTGMLAHALEAYPNESCGAMLGRHEAGVKRVTAVVSFDNVASGPQASRYEIRPEDLLAADRLASDRGLVSIGIYHSHPDCDAYFSETDLKNSCPWYSFVVLSIRGKRFDHARSWLPDPDQTRAEAEDLIHPNGDSDLWQEF